MTHNAVVQARVPKELLVRVQAVTGLSVSACVRRGLELLAQSVIQTPQTLPPPSVGGHEGPVGVTPPTSPARATSDAEVDALIAELLG